MKTEILSFDEKALATAFELLRIGHLVALPTDTVYGLGAWLWNADAIERLYTVKGREAAKAIAVLVGDSTDLAQITGEMNAMAARLAERFWPGALTLVVAAHPALPANLSPKPTVGVRMPNHPLTLNLLRQTGPLAVTSANRSNAANTTTALEVFEQLGGRIPLILDGGQTPGGRPSTVVDCTGPQPLILRPGPYSAELLLQTLREDFS